MRCSRAVRPSLLREGTDTERRTCRSTCSSTRAISAPCCRCVASSRHAPRARSEGPTRCAGSGVEDSRPPRRASVWRAPRRSPHCLALAALAFVAALALDSARRRAARGRARGERGVVRPRGDGRLGVPLDSRDERLDRVRRRSRCRAGTRVPRTRARARGGGGRPPRRGVGRARATWAGRSQMARSRVSGSSRCSAPRSAAGARVRRARLPWASSCGRRGADRAAALHPHRAAGLLDRADGDTCDTDAFLCNERRRGQGTVRLVTARPWARTQDQVAIWGVAVGRGDAPTRRPNAIRLNATSAARTVRSQPTPHEG